jgi:hypothetical protein
MTIIQSRSNYLAFIWHLSGIYLAFMKNPPVDSVIGGYYHRMHALCKTSNERKALQFLNESISNTLWVIPKDHWPAFQRVAVRLFA